MYSNWSKLCFDVIRIDGLDSVSTKYVIYKAMFTCYEWFEFLEKDYMNLSNVTRDVKMSRNYLQSKIATAI